MSKTIQAIRIYLDTVETENPALGIYTSAGTSEIRLSEEPLSGVALTWTSGLIVSIDGVGEGGDLSIGGCIAEYDGCGVELADTYQWILRLKDLGINLSRLKVEKWEFVGTEYDSDATSAGVIFTGSIEDIPWNVRIAKLPLKNDRYKRNAPICSTVTEHLIDAAGVLVPATFGEHLPAFDAAGNMTSKIIAKFPRIQDEVDEATYTNAYFEASGLYSDTKVFPVVGMRNLNGIDRGVKIEIRGTQKWTDYRENTVTDTCLIITEGTGSGQRRKVSSIEWGAAWVCLWMDKVLETDPDYASNDTRSWVQVVKIYRQYQDDVWPCKSFLDTDGNETTIPNVYVKNSDDELKRIADSGLQISGTNGNLLDIDADQYTNDPDTLDSFLIMPVTSAALETVANLSTWSFGSNDLTSFTKLHDGIYIDRTPEVGLTIQSPDGFQNPSNSYDKDASTCATFDVRVQYPYGTYMGYDYRYYKVIKFGLPAIPKGIDIDGIYLGVKLSSYWSRWSYDDMTGLYSCSFVLRRYSRTKATDSVLVNKKYNEGIGAIDDHYIQDLPDFYLSGQDTKNLYFYKDSSPYEEDKYYDINGYKLFEFSNATEDIYNTYVEGGLFFSRYLEHVVTSDNGIDTYDRLHLYDVAIIIKLASASIKKEVFSPARGRIFNDTWGGRKTAANLITKPQDIIEHLCRAQDWGQANPGKAYSSSALIKTTGEGSFDSTNLNYLADQTPAFQIDDEDEAHTDPLIDRLCRVYDVCKYIDEDGYDCLETLELTNPVETISFGDVVPGSIGDMIEPRMQDIFTEPVIKYQYNSATEEYGKELRIYNIKAYADGGSYANSSSGFASQADAEEVLNIYAALYRKYRSTEPPPTDFTDVRFITTYANAKSYLIRKGNKMAKRRQPLAVFYDKGKTYHFGKHAQLNLPHQTGGHDVECVIEKVSKSKNGDRVDMTLVLLEDIPAL